MLVQYLTMKKMDVNHILNQHDKFTKDPKSQNLSENLISMTTLVYYYALENQTNNLFQLLNGSKNLEL